MRTIILTRLIALICGITVINEISGKLNTENAIQNLSVICEQKLNDIPNWQTIQDVF